MTFHNDRVSNNNNGLCPVCGGEHIDRVLNRYVDPITGVCRGCGQVHGHGGERASDTIRIDLERGGFITTTRTVETDAIDFFYHSENRTRKMRRISRKLRPDIFWSTDEEGL